MISAEKKYLCILVSYPFQGEYLYMVEVGDLIWEDFRAFVWARYHSWLSWATYNSEYVWTYDQVKSYHSKTDDIEYMYIWSPRTHTFEQVNFSN